MTEHIEAKHKIRKLTRSELNRAMIDSLLDENERKIITMHYIEHKALGYIADELGYAYSTIKEKHKKAIQKITYLF